jgi:hypothetical protein
VDFFVLEEHRRHDRQLGDRLARGDGGGGLLGEHHGLDREDVDSPLGERGRLLLEGLEILLVGGDVVSHAVVGGHARGGPDGASDPAAGRAHRAGELGTLDVQLAGPVADLVLVELEPGAAERVGLDEVRTRVEVALVDVADHVGMRVVPELGAGPVEEPGVEQRGAVAPVEDKQLARLHAPHDLPAR